jgi:ATPase subunit of ABC transporter with duplicated ATPase domains
MSRLLVQLVHLHKSFGSSCLFNDLSLSIHAGDCFALIGENGSGKTSLLHIMAGLLTPDDGTLQHAPGLSISLLPQEVSFNQPDRSVRSFLEDGPLKDLEQQMEQCLASDRLIEWERLHEAYERKGGYDSMPMGEAIKGLQLEAMLDMTMGSLSSGQRTRVALAKTLLFKNDLLLLDEPTNHLDQQMQTWLRTMLSTRTGATVIVSHDRAFLNATCNRLMELRNGTLSCYGGSYDWYLAERERMIIRQIRAYEAQQEERMQLRKEIKALNFSQPRPKPPADGNIMAYRQHGEHHQRSIQRTLGTLTSRLNEIDANPLHHPRPKTVRGLVFEETPLSTPTAIDIEAISKAFDGTPLFADFSRRLCRGDRVILTGPNGSGKTTFLRCLAKQITIDAGAIRYASDVSIGYLDQEVALLPFHLTPLQYFGTTFRLTETDIRSELHKAALTGGELLSRPFSTLSVGERKRLMLLSLILKRPNVVLLDEPTNHLDLLTLEALETALLNFQGALLAVSHDTTFINKVGTQQWHL